MDKLQLETLIDKKISTRKIANLLNVSQSSIRYWLSKYGLKSKYSLIKDEKTKKCPRCEETKERNEFYNRRNGKGNSVYCKECTAKESGERQKYFKIQCVNYKGGKCEACEYDKYIGALDFHHLNPLKKDFGIAQKSKCKFDDSIKKELDKCILLCSNCHREAHAGILNFN